RPHRWSDLAPAQTFSSCQALRASGRVHRPVFRQSSRNLLVDNRLKNPQGSAPLNAFIVSPLQEEPQCYGWCFTSDTSASCAPRLALDLGGRRPPPAKAGEAEPGCDGDACTSPKAAPAFVLLMQVELLGALRPSIPEVTTTFTEVIVQRHSDVAPGVMIVRIDVAQRVSNALVVTGLWAPRARRRRDHNRPLFCFGPPAAFLK